MRRKSDTREGLGRVASVSRASWKLRRVRPAPDLDDVAGKVEAIERWPRPPGGSRDTTSDRGRTSRARRVVVNVCEIAVADEDPEPARLCLLAAGIEHRHASLVRLHDARLQHLGEH